MTTPQRDSGSIPATACGILATIFLILLLVSAGCSAPTASHQQQAGSPEPVVAPVPVAITATPASYSPAMSSTPGIALTPQVVRVPGDGGVRYHWKTDFGHFLQWDSPGYQVAELGQDTANTGGPVYWSWHDAGGQETEARKVHITLEVTEAGSGALLATGSVGILVQDGIKAQVQPA
jgi:hypothetical protein